MGTRDADIRRRIFERRAAFLTASLATLAGCSGPQPLTPLPSLDAPATDDAGPPDGSIDASVERDLDASLLDVLDEPEAARVVVRACLSIIIPPSIGFGPYGTRIVSGKDTVDSVASVMKDHPEIAVEVQGHTDAAESDPSGRLSRSRAEVVARELRERGIAPERLCVKAYGSSRPIEPNDTPAHRARNRRVEFRKMDDGERCEGDGK